MNDPTDLTAAEERTAERQEQQKLRSEQAVNDLATVLSTENGRRFVNGLLAECGVFRSSFASDPHMTSFYEGQRNAGLRLLGRVLNEQPDRYLLMLKENTSANA